MVRFAAHNDRDPTLSIKNADQANFGALPRPAATNRK